MIVRIGIKLAGFSTIALLLSGSALYGQTPAPAAAQAGVNAGQDSANDLSVAVGKSVLVDVAKPISRVAMGLGDYAQAQAISRTEILINGKTAGATSLIIWDVSGGRQFFNITVRPNANESRDRMDAIKRELRTELPGQTIKVTDDNGNIFLRGTVKDLAASDRAAQIAGTAGKVVNLLYVDVPKPDRQIMLKVRFMSVDRSLEKQLGINFFNTGLGNSVGAVSTGQYSPPGVTLPAPGVPSTATVTNPLQIEAFFPGLDVGATIAALEEKGVVEVLAEPNLLAQNGKQASFLAGGEYPYPVVQGTSAGGAGAVTIQFKEYGVRLNFLPVVTPRGTIRLQVAPEVSSLDYSNEVEIGGFTVPGLTTRRVTTEVELGEGQSFVIGGLLDNRDNESYSKIPGLGDIPILGKLFRSMQKTRTNTELIVIVTPELVSPVSDKAALPELKFPTKFLPPNSAVPVNNPDAKTADNTLPPLSPTMPVEQLILSNQPEPKMVVTSGGVGFGGGVAGAGASTGAAPPVAAPAAPGPAAPQ